MASLLAVATVLGGLAALWYFWDKMRAWLRPTPSAPAPPAPAASAIRDAKIERELWRLEEADRAREEFDVLDKLRLEGFALRDQLKRAPQSRSPRISGPTAPATVPVDNHPGYDVDQWVVKVRVRLKEMNPPELDRYFMSCPLTLTPIERLECYMERIETIIGKIKNRVRH